MGKDEESVSDSFQPSLIQYTTSISASSLLSRREHVLGEERGFVMGPMHSRGIPHLIE